MAIRMNDEVTILSKFKLLISKVLLYIEVFVTKVIHL